MQLREVGLDRRGDFPVIGVVLLGMNAALHADLGGPPLDGFGAFFQQGIRVVDEGIGLVLVPGEATERTAHVADVREVDVAANHVRHVVADILCARLVCGPIKGMPVGSLSFEQALCIVQRDFPAIEGRVKDGRHFGIDIIEYTFEHQAASSSDWWVGRRA